MLASAFLLAATILVPTVSIAAHTSPEIDHIDPKCPPSTFSGFESNVFQYNVPAERFYNKTGSFFRSEWYTGPLTSTHGTDNTVGATRSGNYSGTFFTERLVGYSRSPDELVMRFTLATPGGVVFSGARIKSYTEEMRVMSICGGSATYFSMTAVFCADKVGKVYDLYDGLRRAAVGAVAEQLGALVFDGTCPATPVNDVLDVDFLLL
ncbi:hypothetical protein LshimejAT787_0701480 [Lyophyllum shimeji]|uniref:Uncharacterized protein n=1 Tax=Lyophyllum shimeji TaxID=47721 RepID=A0A9P3UNG0_LYOSH|nr:hypothetical protein LshimejAT787_0701480 [Lyophyllum shimeji]